MMHTATVNLEQSVDVSNILKSPKKELLPILQSLPEWLEVAPQDVEVTQLSGAMTNLIYRCRNLVSGEYVLARVFGSTGALFERQTEQQIFAAVAHAGLGPKLLASFKNGRIEEFLLDQSVTAEQMRTKPIAICIAAAMAMFNFTQLTRLPQQSRPKPICWQRLRNWAKELQALYTEEELCELEMQNLVTKINTLEKRLTSGGPTWVGFCHNDTQYGNMLLHTASQETTEARENADDMLTTRSALDEQPSDALSDCGSIKLGSSPPSFSYLKAQKSRRDARRAKQSQNSVESDRVQQSSPQHTTQQNLELHLWADAFPISQGRDTVTDAWSYSKPDDIEDSQGGSPRKHPRGLSIFASERAEDGEALKTESLPGNPNLSIRFIDYEYAGYNPVALDIANHWCEHMADYHSEPPDRLHPDRFPTTDLQATFTRAYVRAVIALKRQKEELALPTRAGSLLHCLAASAAAAEYESLEDECEQQTLDHLAEKLREAAVAYVPVSHLGWGIWGLLQARLSDVPSFDFTSYAMQRLQQYTKWTSDYS